MTRYLYHRSIGGLHSRQQPSDKVSRKEVDQQAEDVQGLTFFGLHIVACFRRRHHAMNVQVSREDGPDASRFESLDP